MLPSRHTADSTITLLTEFGLHMEPCCATSTAGPVVHRSVKNMHNFTHLYTGAMLLAAQAAQ